MLAHLWWSRDSFSTISLWYAALEDFLPLFLNLVFLQKRQEIETISNLMPSSFQRFLWKILHVSNNYYSFGTLVILKRIFSVTFACQKSAFRLTDSCNRWFFSMICLLNCPSLLHGSHMCFVWLFLHMQPSTSKIIGCLKRWRKATYQ